METDGVPGADEVTYPPPPWHLVGEFHLSVFRLPPTAMPASTLRSVPDDHTPVRIGRRVTLGVAFAHYAAGGVLAYEELLVALLVRSGTRLRCTIPQIWVSGPEPMRGGRELWGIPKQLGTFARGTAGTSVRHSLTVAGQPVARLGSERRGTLPGSRTLRLTTAQALDGRRIVSRNLVAGRLGSLRADWTFAPGGPLGHLAGRRPSASLVITDAEIDFGVEANSDE